MSFQLSPFHLHLLEGRAAVMHPTAFLINVLMLFLARTDSFSAQSKPSKYIGRLEPVLLRSMSEHKIPGLAIGVVEDGGLVYARGFGVMKLGDAAAPVTTETLFHMASITKPLVATAVMQLVEHGKLDLDAPVAKYLPYFRLKDPRYETITVRQMLTHTSGMPDVTDYGWDKPEYDDGSLERYVHSLTGQGLRWQPGTKFAYSNMAFEVLGDLVAKLSGRSFEDYVEAEILKPVGMKSSSLLIKKTNPALLAAGHTLSAGVARPIAHYPYNRAHTPSSNLHSNVNDMVRWMLVNIHRGELDGRRILKAATYDVIWRPAAAVPGSGNVGISWFLRELKGEPLIAHGGGDDGFLTYLIFSPTRGAGVVMMVNTDRAAIKKMWEPALLMALGKEDK
jgi:CubicO group peptidase (beta-lactamase class C family)